jgi:homocysteine S-methyltransferase
VTTLHDRLRTEVLVCDGAMGTMLHAAGNSLDQALPALNLDDPALVRRVHDSYVEAGVDIVQTNTFGASRLRLAEHGLGDRFEEINRAAVRIARDSTRVDRPVLVAASVSPVVSVQQRRSVSAAERARALREHIDVLVDAGVDLVLLETFGHLDELVEAVEIAVEAATVPVVAQATFGGDARTLSGHTPREVVEALAEAGILALGTNCVLGPQRSLQIVRELRRHTTLPLTVQPNAGLPRRLSPARFEYDIDAEYFVRYVRQLVDAGAAVVGGCCGTTPTTLAAVVEAVEAHLQRARPTIAVGATQAPAPTVAAVESAERAGRTVAVQLAAPPAAELEECVQVATEVVGLGIDLLSVVPTRSVREHVNTVDLALHLQQRLRVETFASVTTWDRTSMVLQAGLLGAYALGLRRIVCETGNPPLRGDYPNVDGVWDLDSVGLVALLAGLNDGVDYYGLPVPTKTRFEIGARINPGSHEPVRERMRTLDKLNAGAQFLVTRPIYETRGLELLLEAVDGRVPVLATIAPLVGFDQADFLAHEVPDVTIPAGTVRALHRAGPDDAKAGIDLAAQLALDVLPLVDGLVLAPRQDVVASLHTLLPALPR